MWLHSPGGIGIAVPEVQIETDPMPAKRSATGSEDLFLHEEVALLALRDEQGTFQLGLAFDYAVGGAILAELLLAGRLRVDESSKKQWVRITSSKPLGDPLVDECLDRVATAKRPASLQSWVSRFAHAKKLRPRVAEELCRRGILRADEDKVLWLFRRRIYPEVNPAPERRLLDRMRRAITKDTRDLDARTVAIISLAKSAGLLKLTLDKPTLKRRKVRIEKIINGEVAGKATQEALAAVQAALMVAVILPPS